MATSDQAMTATTDLPEYPKCASEVVEALQGFLSPFAARMDRKAYRLQNVGSGRSERQQGTYTPGVPRPDPHLFAVAYASLARFELAMYQSALEAEKTVLANFEKEMKLLEAA